MKIVIHTIFVALTALLALPLNAQTQFERVLQTGHSGRVSCIAATADGELVATGSQDQSIVLWSASSGRIIRTFNRHTGKVLSVDFSKDGSQLLSTGTDNVIRWFDVKTGRELGYIDCNPLRSFGAVFGLGDSLAIVRQDGRRLNWYNLRTKNRVSEEWGGFSSAAVHDQLDNEVLKAIVGNVDMKGFLWNVENKERISNVSPSNLFKSRTHAISPDGKYVVLATTQLKAEVVSALTGELLTTLIPDSTAVCDGCNTYAVFSPHNQYVAVGSEKSGTAIYKVGSWEKLAHFHREDGVVERIIFSPDDQYVVVSGEDHVEVYNLESKAQTIKVTSDWLDYSHPAVTPKGVLLADELNTITYLNYDGTHRQTFSGFLNSPKTDGLGLDPTNYWDLGILKLVRLKSSIAIHPNGKWFVRGQSDSIAQIIEIRTGRVLQTLQKRSDRTSEWSGEGWHHSQAVYCYGFSPDGKWLATAGGDRKVLVWDLDQPEEDPIYLGSHREKVLDLEFSKDGKFLLSGAWDGSAIIWDLSTQKGRSIDTKGSPTLTRFSNNGLYYAISDLDLDFELWEGDALQPFKQYVGHTNRVTDVAFKSDNRTMISCALDGRIKTWEIGSGMLLDKYAHEFGGVYAIDLHPKTEVLVSGGADRKIYIWNAEGLAYLEGHSGAISHLEFTPDGQLLFSVSVDGEIKVWDFNQGVELYSYYRFSRDQWLSSSPLGYFDGTQHALQYVNYVSGNQVIPVEQLFKKFYTPNLIQQAMDGSLTEAIQPSQWLNGAIRIGVEYAKIGSRDFSAPSEEITIKDSLLNFKVNSKAGAISMVRVYNNEKLVEERGAQSLTNFRSDGSSIPVPVRLNPGKNQLKFIAVDKAGVASNQVKLTVVRSGKMLKPKLYVVALGVDKYKNPSYNLTYAVKDAKALVNAITAQDSSLFSEIIVHELINEQVTKAQVLAVMQSVQNAAQPQDVFLFFFAGHGVLSAGGKGEEFYLVTHDVTNLYGGVSGKGISTADIKEIARTMPAQKQLFALDACHSGGAVEQLAARGSERERALAQLAHSTGTFFLTAAQDFELANEAADLKHGLFTYAVLEIMNGKMATSANAVLTAGGLRQYVEQRVPELAEKYQGAAQYPTSYSFGQDFPIHSLKR